MNDKRQPFKFLTNELDKVKCKGQPRKCWLAQVDSLKMRKPLIKESVKLLRCPYGKDPKFKFTGS